jgi:uncharacterized protein YkwD
MLRSLQSRFPLSAILGIGGLALLLGIHFQPVSAAGAASPIIVDSAFMLQLTAEQSLFELTNADRVANGLDPLADDPAMLDVARQRAASQLGTAALTHYDSDGSLTFVHLLASAQIGYQLAGENLARASTFDATVTERIEQALMRSPTHRKNILEKQFGRVAIGVATDPSGQITFAEIYRN